MASMYHLMCDATHIISHIIEKDRDFEQDRSKYHYAALVIQRHWRGYVARKEIRRWHAAATVIQKWVRRFLVQINMANYMLAHLENMAMRYYNKMATRIEAWWRGVWFRKYVLDFHAVWMKRKRVGKINDEMRDRMRGEKLRQAEEASMKAEMEAKQMILFILFKLHHLLRTDKEGIYSIHGKSNYSWIEKLLKSIKFTDYMKALRKLYNQTYDEPEERECILTGRWRECERAYYNRDRSNDLKPGPPQDPNDFLHAKPFCFDPHVPRKYVPTLAGKGPFIPRIRDIMRTFNIDLNVTETDFDVTQRMVNLKSQIPAYYIDFWSKICEIHNVVTDV